MPKIRSLKPEWLKDEKLGSQEPMARLLFIALITLADDDGRFRAGPSLLRAEAFPYDSILPADVQRLLRSLATARLVTLYTVDGQAYGALPGWSRHQHIREDKHTKSVFPPPPRQEGESIRQYAEGQPEDGPEAAGRPSGSGSGSGSDLEMEVDQARALAREDSPDLKATTQKIPQQPRHQRYPLRADPRDLIEGWDREMVPAGHPPVFSPQAGRAIRDSIEHELRCAIGRMGSEGWEYLRWMQHFREVREDEFWGHKIHCTIDKAIAMKCIRQLQHGPTKTDPAKPQRPAPPAPPPPRQDPIPHYDEPSPEERQRVVGSLLRKKPREAGYVAEGGSARVAKMAQEVLVFPGRGEA